ncbi:MAG: hypothetical protein RBU28_02600 [Bacteroidales bacterium]|jgi:hypothetical protein|nr:hypothetical protein [Bacteroidales bacterium]
MKKFYYILGALQAFTAIGAIPAGYGMLMDTTGEGLGMSADILSDSPLGSFMLPGLFLLLVNGFANIAGAVLSFTKNRYAGHAGIVLGIALTLWIIIQVWWISLSSILQPLYLIIGLVNTWLGWKLISNSKQHRTLIKQN